MSSEARNRSAAATDMWPFSNCSLQWGCFVADVLAATGIRHAFIAPGSRSAPLALGFARALGEGAISVVDERTAGFLALGSAKSSGLPAVVICTSGTAASHFYPALIEARLSEVPMIILSADRPAGMRDCFSGQTIDQLKLFGGYPLWQHEFALPEPTAEAFRYLRQMLVYGRDRAAGVSRGPVHLNFPFRDPLHPVVIAGDCIASDQYRSLIRGVSANPPISRMVEHSALLDSCAAIRAARRGIIVVGPSQPVDPDSFTRSVDHLARVLGWPVFADGLTPLRSRGGQMSVPLITGYDALLRDSTFGASHVPDAVLSIGPLPASKVTRQWLADPLIRTWVVGDTDANWDGLHRNAIALRCAVEVLAAALEEVASPGCAGQEWRDEWLSKEGSVAAAREAAVADSSHLSEPAVAYLVSKHLPPGASLFVGNSMPIRDLEMFAPRTNNAARVFCNRGANGIDGNLATAMGIASHGCKTVALIGDIAFLHDVGSLLNRPVLDVDLTVIVVNNSGGGIFKNLPVSGAGDAFNTFFLTPHSHDIAAVCAAFGLRHELIEDPGALISALATEPNGLSVIEVRCDADAGIKARQAFHQSVARASSVSRFVHNRNNST